jgi:serine/threonine-protein kinase
MATCPTCRTHYPDDVTSCARDGDRLLPDAAFTGADPDLQEGQMVGEYRVEKKLGEGGFGSVYRAVHPLIGKSAAVKVLNRQYSSSPQMVSRFIAEARAVNQIRHRNIIDIFSFGSLNDGRQYYVMELLEGMTCDAFIIDRGRVSPEEAIPILRAIARALDAAHGAGIAHRDLKPENIFFVFDEDGGVFPKLLDFGIAKLLGDSGMSSHKTRTGTPLGTPHYMSPEQCRGKDIDHRTDIYSFGIVTYAMLTGQVPFDGGDVMDILVKQVHERPRALSSVCPELPAILDAPVLHMLEKDPAARPESLTAAVDALAKAASEAGYSVQVSSGRGRGQERASGGVAGANEKSPSGRQLTPAQESLSNAQTMAQGDAVTKTVLAADTLPVAPPKRRAAVLVAALALVLCGGVGVILFAKPSRDLPAPAQPAPEAFPTASLPAVMGPEATARPTDVVPAVAAPATHVEVTVNTVPAGAEVSLAGEKLGVAPGPFRIKRGDASVKLTVKAAGHTQQSVDVTPTANTAVTVTLTRAPVQRKKPETEF